VTSIFVYLNQNTYHFGVAFWLAGSWFKSRPCHELSWRVCFPEFLQSITFEWATVASFRIVTYSFIIIFVSYSLLWFSSHLNCYY